MGETLSKTAFAALRWNYVGFVTRSVSNLIIGIILARLLGPKPFGQLAATTLIIGLANLLADAGFTSALVQAPDLTKIQVRYVFTVQCAIAIVLTIVCMGIAGPVAYLFRDHTIRNIILVTAPIFILQAMGQTSSAILRRELAFRSLQIAQVLSYLGSYVLVGLPLAALGAGVWSLVVAQLFQALIYSILLYRHVRHSVVPTLHHSGAQLLRFGSTVTIANIVSWGITNLDNAVVGHSFGVTNLGLYSRGFTLASAPADGIVSTTQQVLFASCSRAGGRIEPIRRAYIASLSAMAIAIFPAFWTMSACASTVMVGLYGERWRSAAGLLRPLVIAVSVSSLMALAGPILASMNQVRREVSAQSLALLVALLSFGVTSHISPTALAWGVCGVYVFRFLAVTRPVLGQLHLTWLDLVHVLAGPGAIAIVTTLLLYLTNTAVVAVGLKPFPALCVLCICGCILLPVLLIRFGAYVLAPPLIVFLQTGLPGMPKRLAGILDDCATKQRLRGPEKSQWA